MASIEKLLDMVWDGAFAQEGACEERPDYHQGNYEPPVSKQYLPPIQYNLELIQNPDGSLSWVE